MPHAEREMEALWRAVFGEPPSVEADLAMLSEILVRHLPLAPPYRPENARADTSRRRRQVERGESGSPPS